MRTSENFSLNNPRLPAGRQGFAAILILVLVAAIIILGGVFYVKHSKKSAVQSTVQISPSPLILPTEETANWKTYTNTKYKYSFKYPNGSYIATIEHNEGAAESLKNLGTANLITINRKMHVIPELNRDAAVPTETIFTIVAVEEKTVASERMQNLKNTDAGAFNIVTTKFGDKDEFKFSDASQNVIIYDQNIHYNFRSDDQELLDQILSTFKFTDQNQNADSLVQQSISPDGNYIVQFLQAPSGRSITIKNKSGDILIKDVLSLNWPGPDDLYNRLHQFGLKGAGMTGWKIGSWQSNSVFELEIDPVDGSIFTVDVDATTGKIIDSTFKAIKIVSQ